MNIENELKALHKELYELYSGKSTNLIRIRQLWARIDKLEDVVREREAWDRISASLTAHE